jgi:hypothetical protein
LTALFAGEGMRYDQAIEAVEAKVLNILDNLTN